MMALLVTAASVAMAAGARVDVAEQVRVIRTVGPEGRNAVQAAQAWRRLGQAEIDQLPEILAAMDGASALARNWLRSAADVILDRAQASHRALPVGALVAFLGDSHHDPQARRLAYELVLGVDKSAAERLLPGMLHDRSADLRRDAVARVLAEAQKRSAAGKKAEALALTRQAFEASRDRDQINEAARRLKELGEKADIPAHLGIIRHWKTLGPFPNEKQQAGDTVYPPEKNLDLKAEYDGKAGKIRWKDFTAAPETGLVDLNQAVGKDVKAVAYAQGEFVSPTAQDAEIRLGSLTAFQLWVNGRLLLDRRDAFTGAALDSYSTPVHLAAGRNIILVKVWQDEPPEERLKGWRFVLRVCDDTGGALPAAKPN